ncbi:MAG TPA: signal peptide peptidase SppA [Candidatus Bacteroides merdigallinarum]|uniref:Signal peptide peptidase SppA n=1 Tax=Candidatus Bacteroides merdigallinarum TaxID=2838473 RepID=A0A9D2E9K7_9BACE|nr:signal peptide peptidase SppA [Candidatus Bacteroides merdigallinarum]
MKDFLKFTLATITGIIVSSVLLFVISILVMFSMLYSSDAEVTVPENAIFKLELNGTLSERSQENPLSLLMDDDLQAYGLDDLLSAIQKAKVNENIQGIYIETKSLAADGYASLKAVRDALADFKASGKFIVAYGDTYTQGLYYLASVADRVILNPQGMLEWTGLASSPMFYKDLMDKVGIRWQIFKVGTYKSAVEPRTAMKMSDANREQVTDYLGSLWGQITADVSASRGISVDSLNEAADRMLLLQPAEECLAYGLADTLMYKNDVRDYLKQRVGIDPDDNLHMLGLKDMLNVKKNVPKDKSGNIVAVYYACGQIGSGLTGEEGIEAEKVCRDLRELKEDEDVKAVVLRINSPGGSAYESEQIWYAVSELKKEKPVIVSMGDYAASGGYYIACNADTLVAEPTTLTGSIGIFGMVPDAEGLAQKIGVGFDVVKTNAYGDFGMPTRPMTESEKALMQAYVERGYDLFLSRVAEGRGMSKEAVDRVGQGRVWTGLRAKELGLVDELGGLDRAIEIAVAKAGVDAYTRMDYPGKKSAWEQLKDFSPSGYVRARLLQGEAGHLFRQVETLNAFDLQDALQARMEFEPTLY